MIECQNFLIGRWTHSATLDAQYNLIMRYDKVFQVWNFMDEKTVEITIENGVHKQYQYHHYVQSHQLVLFNPAQFCTVNSSSFYEESYIIEVVDQSKILLIDPDLIIELQQI